MYIPILQWPSTKINVLEGLIAAASWYHLAAFLYCTPLNHKREQIPSAPFSSVSKVKRLSLACTRCCLYRKIGRELEEGLNDDDDDVV